MEEEIKEQKSNLSLILNTVFAVIILALALIMFFYGNFGSIPKDTLDKEYIKKSDISFDDLEDETKAKYILLEKAKDIAPKIIYKDKIIKPEPEIKYIEKVVKTAPEVVEKEVEKIIYKDNILDKTKFNVFRCYGMNAGSYYLTKECQEKLKIFITNNKNSKYFEVIGITDKLDFKLLKKVENSEQTLENLHIKEKDIQKLRALSTKGLAKLRVEETIWDVKKLLQNSTIEVSPVSYNIETEDIRGSVIRAYK